MAARAIRVLGQSVGACRSVRVVAHFTFAVLKSGRRGAERADAGPGGTSDLNEPRFDATFGGEDAIPGAPQAGKMFDAYLTDLLKNANPPL